MPTPRHLPALLLPLLAGIAVVFAWRLPASFPAKPRPARPDPPLIAPAPAIEPLHPVAPAPVRPLPRLEESDAATREALARIRGSEPLAAWLAPSALLWRFVATVDYAPGPHLPARLYPLARPRGGLLVAGDADATWLAAGNASRYEPYVQALEGLDAGGAVALYARLYPLLQQTYVAVAERGEHFNDRLVAAIDDLLAAPEPGAPPELVRDGVLYRFADPHLEARSGGQKLMIRIGARNAARVKAKLGEFRRLLAPRATPR